MSVYKTSISNKMLIVLIIICLSVLSAFIFFKEEKTILTFNEFDNSNKTYIIDVEGRGITTRNLNCFDYNDIVALYPDISIKYSKLINSGWYNVDKTKSFINNIKIIERYYQNIFSKNEILNEALNIEYNGILIKKIKVITNNVNKYKNYRNEKGI